MYQNLRELRILRGITAKEMADTLKLKTEAAYYKKESGMTKFSLNEARIIAEKLGMPIEQIFFGHTVSCNDTNGLMGTGC